MLSEKKFLQYKGEQAVLGEGNIEIYESYFGAKRVRGKRIWGDEGKTKVFGMLKTRKSLHSGERKLLSKRANSRNFRASKN